LRRALRCTEKIFSVVVILQRIGDVNHLQRSASQQDVEGKHRVQSLIPEAHSAGHDSVHGNGTIKATGILLDQRGGDQAAHGMSPGNGLGRSSYGASKNIERCKLIRDHILHVPTRRRVGRTRQRVSRRE